MSEVDRTFDGSEEAIAALQRKVDELEAKTGAQWARRPTGAVDMVFRGTPQEGTLFLQGQLVSRVTYAALWVWAQASGSVVAGGYTVGDGSTTFGLPDMRDKFLVGAGGTITLGGTGGAATRVLTTANLPAHDHDVSVAAHGNHEHTMSGGTGNTGFDGAHGGHHPTAQALAAAGPDLGLSPWNASGAQLQSHDHSVSVSVFAAGSSAGSHSVTETSVGTGTEFDNRPPYLGVNLAVWV